jgi:dihydroorotase
MLIHIRGGRVIDPSRGLDEPGDVWIDGDRLIAGPGAEPGRVIEAAGLWVVPGLIDLHVHLREPGHEYKEDIRSGAEAGAAGGFSAICAMPNTSPPNDTRAVTEMILRRAREVAGSRVYPVAAVTRERAGTQLTEMGDLLAAGAVAFSDDGAPIASSGILRSALDYAATFGALIMDHPDDPSLSGEGVAHEGARATRLGLAGMPSVAEDLCVMRDVLVAEYLGARIHLQHVSSAGAVRIIAEAKARGVRVTAEVTPHHLVGTDELLEGYPSAAKVSPPLRSARHRDACRRGLAEGTLDAIATDHAPQSVLEKDELTFGAAAFGIAGLESAVPLALELVRDGVIAPLRMIEALSTAPARILGVRGGTLAPGGVADVTLIDPEDPHAITPSEWRSKARNTPFAGRQVPGRAVMTIVDGRIVHERPKR